MAGDFTIDGRAEIRAYPWDYTEWHKKPDPHGPDYPQRADGLTIEGNGFVGEQLRFFQIPGTAIRIKGGRGKQAGAFGIYDNPNNTLDWICASPPLNGNVVETADSKLHAIYISASSRH